MIVIATSGPSSTYPQRAYRNPTDALVRFLDTKHGNKWAIWEFRAEGTGYPDSEVYGRIRHYPWPDHHPPPFALIPNIMASMRDWLQGGAGDGGNTGNVAVVHCKAGKGRSGTVACSYLISEQGWAVDDALMAFTARRMRSGFGSGVSIPSQLRWVGYVAAWARHGKLYVERRVEVLEVHVWGLKEGVKVGINGYVDEGKTIKTFHVFGKSERIVVNGSALGEGAFARTTGGSYDEKALPLQETAPRANNTIQPSPNQDAKAVIREQTGSEQGGEAVIFRPSSRVILPSNDIDIDFERRNKAGYGWTMVTSVAHVWFNAFFEGRNPHTPGQAASDGVFEINWENMDGIKGSARKGVRALDRLAVVWRALPEKKESLTTLIITEPLIGAPVPQTAAADWKGAHSESKAALGKDLGLRTETPVSATVSKASSIASPQSLRSEDDPANGVKTHGINGEDHIPHDWGAAIPHHAGPSVSLPSLAHFDRDPDSPHGDSAEKDTKTGGIKDPRT